MTQAGQEDLSAVLPQAGTAPELEWLEDGVPRAGRFGDTYFSRAGGLAETGHVFHAGNGLPQRMAGRQGFTIGELGFGTGLNLLATLKLIRTLEAPPQLTFLSFEAYPLTLAQLERAHAAFPDVAGEAAELRPALAGMASDDGALTPGWHLAAMDGARLWLGIGDARSLLPELTSGRGPEGLLSVLPVEAWFLDGFSPAKNPELWSPELMASVHGLTAAGGTFATYSAAGWVRRNLEAAGFEVERIKGFAGKRQMMRGARR
ncbi:tRNA 5-methylaminomethyl-2-thiouridine biosynthesis bifunctional protein MnmC [Pannonibacter phragmitetus]|uniref:tRNA 5-methylaminomethyl-2-thiouridine biosynthesis bifunctional protein MnmC n=1 Tax=Pannonibacter phragmitetus TaxID=121719 RepID=A0A378ZSL1_9HYPH|nr:tRNA (5-methylaminomethyl-2-thiouridine)(34)-methyltransferase MnmD [Pannonibacter phragmitetus]SUB00194.1 tRNA 5-methylaminomethyl-2-thiouridine biosynthesis bifunctional protein MnmC [Pannonibacter phragmitetus]